MTPEQLSKVCRCGHARRFHQQGTIWEGYATACYEPHPGDREYGHGCHYFEDAAVRIVQLRRLPSGRFAKAVR